MVYATRISGVAAAAWVGDACWSKPIRKGGRICTMPTLCPRQFRGDVVCLARSPQDGVTIALVARSRPSCVRIVRSTGIWRPSPRHTAVPILYMLVTRCYIPDGGSNAVLRTRMEAEVQHRETLPSSTPNEDRYFHQAHTESGQKQEPGYL